MILLLTVVETIILDVLETPVEGTSVDKKDVEIDGIIGVPDDGVKIEVCFDDETDCVVENENGGWKEKYFETVCKFSDDISKDLDK